MMKQKESAMEQSGNGERFCWGRGDEEETMKREGG